MSNALKLSVGVIVLVVVLLLFSYMGQRTNAPMRSPEDQPSRTPPGST